MTQYKYDEIKSYFEDWIEDQDKEWINDNIDDLHHHCFIIDTIKEYENDNLGEVNTDFSDPEKVVNMYVYIIGEEIVSDYRNQLEDKGVINSIRIEA